MAAIGPATLDRSILVSQVVAPKKVMPCSEAHGDMIENSIAKFSAPLDGALRLHCVPKEASLLGHEGSF